MTDVHSGLRKIECKHEAAAIPAVGLCTSSGREGYATIV